MVNSIDYRSRFQKSENVSRETMEALDQYSQLLNKWNRAINLVSPSTLPQLWSRHFLDSAQIRKFLPIETKAWVDIGSGAGFPGLVVSCLEPEIFVTCLESDQRKSVFLQTVIRELGLNANVIAERIEKVPPMQADVISARALAPVSILLEHAERHLRPGGTAIFLKGSTYMNEVEAARMNWSFDIKAHPSKTDHEGAVLIFGDIKRE